MTTINTNVSSLIAKNAIGQNERAMSQAMTRLSTGNRINSARDDAAGLAISERMSSQISGLKMASRNANDAISLLQTVEGATKEISSMLGRMRELAVQAASGTYTTTDQAALDLEFGALLEEIDRVAKDTEWNGNAVLSGAGALVTEAEVTKDYAIQVGTDAAQTMGLAIKSWRPKVAVDNQMTDATGANRDGLDSAVGETKEATFGTLTTNGAFTLAGITVTVGAGGSDTTTGAQLATYFAALAEGGAHGSVALGKTGTVTTSGTFTGFSTGSVISSTKVVFTNTGTNSATELALSGTAGSNDPTLGSTVAGTVNQSAYSSGVMYWGTTPTRIDITSSDNASRAITEIDSAINGAASERAKYGAYMSRLQHASDNLTNVATNTAASRSQIADADYASETTELARTQIISQASTAMLAQANQVKQTVLALLK